jgi:hypothetical protein
MVYLDAFVGSNDNPVLEFPTGVITTSQDLTGDDIPPYWTLYEDSVHQDTSATISQGVFYGDSMLMPDQVAFSNQDDLEDEVWLVTVTPDVPLTDLAVAVKWDLELLTPYSWYVVQFYYGGGYPSFGIHEKPNSVPENFSLGNPYPNPFNAAVSVPVEIKKNSQQVSWNIYDLTGRVVRHSAPQTLEPGDYNVRWNCRGDNGEKLSSGLYLFAFWADGRRATKRLVILE